MSVNCDLDAEVTFFRLVCSRKVSDKVKSRLLAKVSGKTFGYIHSREIYRRFMKLVHGKGVFPLFEDLINDPVISEEAREFLKDRSPKRLNISRQTLRSIAGRLELYEKIRGTIDVATALADGILQPGVEIDDLIEKASVKLNELKMAGMADEKIYHFGVSDNAESVVSKTLAGVIDPLHSTGFYDFDSRNGGFPSEGLVILAGTTSGGKSVLANMLLKHFYLEHNMSVIKVTMEMSERQETRRLLSSLTRIPYSKFTRNQLTPGETQTAKKKMSEFRKHGVTNNCRFSIWSPQSSVDMDKVLLMIKPFGYNVVVIDYITLLDERSDEQQWKVLSDVARKGKVFSRNTRSLVILLAQLDEDTDKVRYSRAIKEHADVAWAWNYSKKEHRDARMIQIRVMKGRDMDIFNFDISERFDIMTLENLNDSDADSRDAIGRPKNQDNETEVKDEIDETINDNDDLDRPKKAKRSQSRDKKPESISDSTTKDPDELDLDDAASIDYDTNGMY